MRQLWVSLTRFAEQWRAEPPRLPRMTPTEEELDAMVSELDTDGSGDIDLEVPPLTALQLTSL